MWPKVLLRIMELRFDVVGIEPEPQLLWFQILSTLQFAGALFCRLASHLSASVPEKRCTTDPWRDLLFSRL